MHKTDGGGAAKEPLFYERAGRSARPKEKSMPMPGQKPKHRRLRLCARVLGGGQVNGGGDCLRRVMFGDDRIRDDEPPPSYRAKKSAERIR